MHLIKQTYGVKIANFDKTGCTVFALALDRNKDEENRQHVFSLSGEDNLVPDSGRVCLVRSDYSFQKIKKEIILNYLTKFVFYTLPLLRISLKLFVLWLHRE